MAGLIAVVSAVSEATVLSAEFDALKASYHALRGTGEVQRHAAGDIGVAGLCAEEGSTGAGSQTGESWAVYIGDPHHPAPLAVADPATLDGQFALITYDAVERQVEIVSDPFGLQAIFLAERAGLLYISTSALTLARHLRSTPSVLGLEVFLRTGPHYGELTNWEGIRRLPPATQVTIRRGAQVRERVYWSPAIDRAVSRMGRPEAARHCVEVAVETFRDRLAGQEDACCDLTGGFDSRLSTLLLDRAGVGFGTTTVGSNDSDDVALGSRVARTAGWPWTQGQLPGGWPERSRAAVAYAVAWGDGQMEATQLAEVLTVQGQLRSARLFGGGGGEHWRDYAWQQEIPGGGRTTRVNFERWVDVRSLHPQDLSPLRSDPTQRVRANLVERCRAHAAPFGDLLNSAQLDVLYAYKSMGHFGAYQSASRGTMNVELPFYFRDAFIAPFSVAPAHRNSHRLMREAIPLLDRSVARLPTTTGGPAEPFGVRNAHRFPPYLKNRASNITRKLTERLPMPTIGAIRTSMPVDVREARQRQLDELIATTGLEPARMRAGRLYDARGLSRLASSPAATTGGWATLGRIITVELALEAVDLSVD